MEINIASVQDNKGRKRIRNEKQWKRNVQKRARSATSTRKYVSSDLNIKKMWRLYQENQTDENLKVRHCFFRRIFVVHYNIGFKTPRVDICSKCSELSEKIKNEKVETEKVALMTALRIHKLKPKSFYMFLRELDDETFTISFDCQKNQVLPKVADQIAYYSRQLYIYNFTIVIGTSTNKFQKENVRICTWTENVHAKSSNEIASAVFDLLSKADSTGKKKIRMMADGCGSQNKNSTMIAMVAHWLIMYAPRHIKTIELIFPVPGHSFMPGSKSPWTREMVENDILKWTSGDSPGNLDLLAPYLDSIFQQWGYDSNAANFLKFKEFCNDPMRWGTSGGAKMATIEGESYRSKWAWAFSRMMNADSSFKKQRGPVKATTACANRSTTDRGTKTIYNF
ncbi:uncharacterized protein LOC114362131 isoform X2 [Ostrinia furnacalis]|uniref:uncharacterized protein LOC114362131 isoform X2 n=1 Tax=Ostrinia furnacalis TaxID=93504 RepID=UPI00103DB3D0|nr:uncharacterized protein LOC114362131 isoform X2 [Ostrinia furnacalis]